MRVEWSGRAKRALRARLEFLERKNPRAAAAMEAVVRAAAARLAAFPHVGRPSSEKLRELVVPYGSGGYLMKYAVTAELVLIIDLKHQREDGF